MIRIGIVGAGGIAAQHAAAVRCTRRAKLAAVYTPSRQSAERAAANWGGGLAVCESYAQLLELVDAVVICSPNDTHPLYVREAVQAGKAALCEKPLGVSAAQCAPLLQDIEAGGVVAGIGFVYRFSPQVQLLRQVLREQIGRVYTLQASVGGMRLADSAIPLEWRMRKDWSGSGAYGDFGSHLIDLADYAAGLRFDALRAQLGTFIQERAPDKSGHTTVENDDAAVMTGVSRAGALASFCVSRVGWTTLEFFVAGEGGMARMCAAEGDRLHILPKPPGGAYAGAWRTLPVPAHTLQDWFVAQLEEFLNAIEAGALTGALPGVAQGLYVQQLLDNAQQKNEQET